MGDDKWIRRQPGRASGTVMPPPAGEDLPPLPQRRSQYRARLRQDGDARGRPGSGQPAAPELPDNVRLLFRPVLLARDESAAGGGLRRPAGRPPQRADDPPQRTDCPPQRAGLLPRRAGRPPRRADGPPGRQRRGGPRHAVWLAALTVLLLVTAAGTAVALVRHPAAGARTGPAAGTGVPGVAAAAAARSAAARWIEREVSRGSIIGCDAVLCSDLVRAGMAAGDLVVVRPASPDPLGADIVIATPALRSEFGRTLSSEYAPVVLAAFGTGRSRVAVRVIAPDGAAAYRLTLRRDLAARQRVGGELAGNPRIALPASARAEVEAGLVDPRLLATLAALTAKHPVSVLSFYDRPPGASPGIPLAGAQLSGADPRAGLPARVYLRWLTSFLRGQRSLYRAASVQTFARDGHTVVSVRFARPSPFGLLHDRQDH